MSPASPLATVRRATPFAFAAAVAFGLVGLTGAVAAGEYVSACGVLAAVAVLALALPGTALAPGRNVLPALLFLAAAALLRDAGGGSSSGVGIVALLPVTWVSLHGNRADLVVVLAGVVAFYAAPAVVIGGGAYPASGFRTAIVSMVVGAVAGFAVQRLVAQVRAHAEEVERHTRDLQRVAAISRDAARGDARAAVCRAAVELAEATFAFLMEPDRAGGLVSTAMHGLDAPQVRGGGPEAPTMVVFRSGEPLFLSDAAGRPGVDLDLWAVHGRPASMLFQPVLRQGAAVGVLVIGWAEPVPAGHRPAIVSLLASEAAYALEAADVVEQLTDLASVDALTGIPNRRAWDGGLATALSGAPPMCVALLDVDRFKDYNDTWGHQAGDRLLKAAAAAWRAVLRPEDLLARLGGDEFGVLLPGCDLAAATAILERLRDATPGEKTCSIGLAAWDGREPADALVARADEALYRAKAAGRDRTVAVAA